MTTITTVPTPTASDTYELQSIAGPSSRSKGLSTDAIRQVSRLSHESSSSDSSRGRRLDELDPRRDVAVDASLAPSSISHPRANIIVFQLALTTFLCSLSSGLITVGLPRIATDLDLSAELYLWPSSVYGLTSGSVLLLAGAVADVVGSRSVELTGCTLLGAFTLACGLSRTGIQLVIFRALQGVALAMHSPCSVGLIAHYVPSGKRRNLGFACIGLSMPLGFATGLVLGGVLVDTIGWRSGFYICGSVLLLQVPVGFRVIPVQEHAPDQLTRIRKEVDWIGASLACGALSMFSYVLAVISANSNNISRPSSIAILIASVLLTISFPFWMSRQTKRGLPALIPNDLWKNLPFACICVITIISWGVGNSIEIFSSLYFQEVQELSALTASIHLLPSFVMAVMLNLFTGYFVDRAPIFWVVFISTCLSAGSPLLMALIDPSSSYWAGVFPAQVLAPISGDILFTVGLIIVSEVFPEKTQALAGAVYNTVAQFGWCLGINSMQVVSMLVTQGTSYRDKSSPSALLQGYRASFWAMFGATMACALVIVIGLRNVGKIGLKRE